MTGKESDSGYLLIFPIFFRNVSGGAVQAALRLMRGVKDEHRVLIATPTVFSIREELEKEGLTVCPVIKITTGNVKLWKLLNPLFLFRYFLRVKREIRRSGRKPVFITNDFSGELATGLVFPRTPRICISRGGDYSTLTGILMQRLSFRSVNRFIAISESEADKLRRMDLPEEKITLIHDGIEEIPLREQRPLSRDRMNIACVGFYNDNKNQLLAIEALIQFRAMGFEAQLNLYGGYAFSDAVYLERIKSRIAQAGLQGRVAICGFRQPEEIFSINDLLLSVSRSEGLGLSVLEAMAYGVPVVSTDSGGVRTLIRHRQEGLIAGSFDADAVAASLREMVTDESLRDKMVRNARERYESCFRIERTVERFREVIHQI